MAINPFRILPLEIPANPQQRPIDFSGLERGLSGLAEGYNREKLKQQIGALTVDDGKGGIDYDATAANLARAGLLSPSDLQTAGLRKQQIDKDRLPAGWRATAAGGHEPIPGGAADPEYLRRRAEAEAKTEAPTWGVVGEDQWGGKTHGWIDPARRTVTPHAPAGGAPQQPPTITLPSGEVLTVPQGMDPKKFREHVTNATADAMAGKATETQSNAQTYGARMENAEPAITQFGGHAAGPAGNKNKLAEKLPMGEYMMTPEYQRFYRAKLDWITAVLRKESGAAIGADEYVREDKKFFPQPGDDPKTIEDKARARAIAQESMKRAAGPGYKSPSRDTAPPAPAISAGAINYLRNNPGTRDQFDAKYGPGAADRALGGR